jgi:AcrR family transcriptional regulator
MAPLKRTEPEPRRAGQNRRASDGPRGRVRRDQIIEVAVELFGELGYAKTTLEDIGEASGVTGPAIYRHFRNKEQILVAVFAHSHELHYGQVLEVIAKGLPPLETLSELVDLHIRMTLDQAKIVTMFSHEMRHLGAETHRIVSDNYHEFRASWIDSVLKVRPELDRSEALGLVEGVMWLLKSPAYYRSEIPRPRLEKLLHSMGMAALLVGAKDPVTT